MNLNDVLIKPLVTEKTTQGKEKSIYTFVVHSSANKISIKEAVKKIFNADVRFCRVVNVKPKRKALRKQRGYGQTAGVKKAMIFLKAGQKISELDV